MTFSLISIRKENATMLIVARKRAVQAFTLYTLPLTPYTSDLGRLRGSRDDSCLSRRTLLKIGERRGHRGREISGR